MMRRALEIAIACLLAAGPLYAQQIGIPIKRGVITVDSAPSGDCSAVPGQVRQIRGTRETYVCESGSWVRKDLPVCSPDPPSGSCSDYSVCMSTTGALYVCASGTWAAISGTGDMARSVYDTDTDGTVDAAEKLSGDAIAADYILGDSDGDGTYEVTTADGLVTMTGTDPGSLLDTAIDNLTTTGGVVLLRGTITYTSTVPSFEANIQRPIVVRGDRAKIVLSSSAPRAFDINRTADYQTFKNIWIERLDIDANNTTGFHHVIFGDYVSGSVAQRVNFDHIRIRDVYAYNIPGDITETTSTRACIDLRAYQPTNNESTQNTITDVVISNVKCDGGNIGVSIGGYGGGTATQLNVWLDDIVLFHVWHKAAEVPTSFYSASNFHIGKYASGGKLLAIGLYGENGGDNGLEINGFLDATAIDCVMKNQGNVSFYTRNLQPHENVDSDGDGTDDESVQTVRFINCTSIFDDQTLNTTHPHRGFAASTLDDGDYDRRVEHIVLDGFHMFSDHVSTQAMAFHGFPERVDILNSKIEVFQDYDTSTWSGTSLVHWIYTRYHDADVDGDGTQGNEPHSVFRVHGLEFIGDFDVNYDGTNKLTMDVFELDGPDIELDIDDVTMRVQTRNTSATGWDTGDIRFVAYSLGNFNPAGVGSPGSYDPEFYDHDNDGTADHPHRISGRIANTAIDVSGDENTVIFVRSASSTDLDLAGLVIDQPTYWSGTTSWWTSSSDVAGMLCRSSQGWDFDCDGALDIKASTDYGDSLKVPSVLYTPTSSLTTCGSGNEGQVYYDSDDGRLLYCDGSSWQKITSRRHYQFFRANVGTAENSYMYGEFRYEGGNKIPVDRPGRLSALQCWCKQDSTGGTLTFQVYRYETDGTTAHTPDLSVTIDATGGTVSAFDASADTECTTSCDIAVNEKIAVKITGSSYAPDATNECLCEVTMEEE